MIQCFAKVSLPATGEDGTWGQEWMGMHWGPLQGPAEFVGVWSKLEAVQMGWKSGRTTVQGPGVPDQGEVLEDEGLDPG